MKDLIKGTARSGEQNEIKTGSKAEMEGERNESK